MEPKNKNDYDIERELLLGDMLGKVDSEESQSEKDLRMVNMEFLQDRENQKPKIFLEGSILPIGAASQFQTSIRVWLDCGSMVASPASNLAG